MTIFVMNIKGAGEAWSWLAWFGLKNKHGEEQMLLLALIILDSSYWIWWYLFPYIFLDYMYSDSLDYMHIDLLCQIHKQQLLPIQNIW